MNPPPLPPAESPPTPLCGQSLLRAVPVFTALLCAACAAIYGRIALKENGGWDNLGHYGFLDAWEIWDGGYWALITSSFVHTEFWHLAFNLYWLWVLGRRVEQSLGLMRFIGFVAFTSFVSSSCELAVSDTTGIGVSGVVYALFGFMWPLRASNPDFKKVITSSTIHIFIVWMVLWMLLSMGTETETANAAHAGGLAVGLLTAFTFMVPRWRRAAAGVMAAFTALSIVPLFWCPWSTHWVSWKAWRASESGNRPEAIALYSEVIARDPQDPWAYSMRSYLYTEQGETERAAADEAKAAVLEKAADEDDQ